MSPKRKAIFFVMLIIIGLSGISLIQKNRLYQKNLTQSMQQNIDEVRLLVNHNLNASTSLFLAQLQHLTIHHREIVEAFYQHDREKLFAVTLPSFNSLKKLYPEFSHMHFHLPNGQSFLRMHAPNEFGDDLTTLRPMIAQIHADNLPKSGYEVGVHGMFYRVAEPVFWDGIYIGALELGIQPQILLRDIESILGIEIGLFLSANPASPPSLNWPGKLSGFQKLTSLNGDNDPVFADVIDPSVELTAPRKIDSPEGCLLVYSAGDILDFRENVVGYLVIAQNIEKIIAEQRRFILTSCLVTFLLVIVAYLVLHFTFGVMIQKIISLNKSLEQRVEARTQDLLESKKNTENMVIELRQIFNTAAGGMRILDKNYRTIKINKTFENMVGLSEDQILGTPCHELFSGELCHTQNCTLKRILNGEERIELKIEKKCTNGTRIPCILTATPFRSPEGELLGVIEDFKDITVVECLLDQQKINIGLAQRVLNLVNSNLSRHVEINQTTALFSDILFSSCHAAGGDHCFIREFAADSSHPDGRTVLSLKDQSGHEVNCVLKSIATDLMHNVVLHASDCLFLDYEINKLNRELCESKLFNDDDFITAINVEIDHATMTLKYISCGHPPFLLIRGGEVTAFPVEHSKANHLPLAVTSDIRYTSEKMKIQVGDQIIFFTDGLTDMPLRNTEKVLSIQQLKLIIHTIINQAQEPLHVSELINELFFEIARLSQEEIIPFQKNTSKDDVTLLGIEVEDTTPDGIKQIHIKDLESFAAHIEELHSVLLEQAQQKNVEISSNGVRTVLEESIINAWKHGHGCSPEKPITVRWRFRNDFHLEVIDQGSGFNYEHLANPLSPENLLKESGRGLYMIRLFANAVSWENQGRHIKVSFKPTAPWDRRGPFRAKQLKPFDIWKAGTSD